ncbi:hypothetical protein PG994_007875 [Apiospora phragmitis]|uniref:gamma-glutamylcyclotransferase n=1 Tax=Apiospora phragmitis TaxID=2905665 RepID=A0ABR1URG8_9PEZI
MCATQGTNHKLYFAYGSNLSCTQMKKRCPGAAPVALGHLRGWRWIINERGFANIVEDPAAAAADNDNKASAPGVYGVLYTLPPDDEAELDVHEGVPTAYEKEMLDVEVVQGTTGSSENDEYRQYEQQTLVYIDYHRVKADSPRPEYVSRMDRGIAEARRDWSLPDWYIDQVMRKFIPEAS